MTRKRVFIIIIHVLAWAAFLSLPTAFKPVRPDVPANNVLQDMMHAYRWLNGLFLIGFFYYNYYIIILRYYFGKQYISFVLSLLI
jgi:hypothetical protein